MTPAYWQKVKAVMEQVLEQAPENQATFLRETCAGDTQLYHEVCQLLAAEGEMQGFLETPAMKQLEGTQSTLTDERTLPDSSQHDPVAVGHRFLNKYEILRVLGQGGMGKVFQARHVGLGSMVAIKVLNPLFTQNPDAGERFQREARTAARIEHPNTVRVFDFGVQETTCYLVMEYLEGETLGQRLKRCSHLPLAEVQVFAEQVCAALEFVHQKGVIHRDLKPDNIFFQRRELGETVKILDFGIAKLNTLTIGGGTLTNPGSVCGTPTYMSPEQCQGVPVDRRTDLYSLGVILYEMLSGQRPFAADGALSLMYAHVNLPPKPLQEADPEIPPNVAEIVMRLLAKPAGDRFQSALEFLNAFVTALENPETGKMQVRHTVEIHSGTQNSPQVVTLAPTLIDQSAPALEKNSPVEQSPTRSRVKRLAPLAALFVLAFGSIGVWQWNGLLSTPVASPVTATPAQPHLAQKLGSSFAFIPGGTFSMGRNPDSQTKVNYDRPLPDEMPAHVVTLAPYYLSMYEVTNREYRDFVRDTNHRVPNRWLKSQTVPDDWPVTDVSWEDATAYCEWRSKRDGISYRLPTEAEWEFAARGQTEHLFPWGNEWKAQSANLAQTVTVLCQPDTITSSLNTKLDKSPFGVYSMAGNVSEWTTSDFTVYPGSTYQLQPKDKGCKVYRGGSYITEVNNARTQCRAWRKPKERDDDLGFRLAVSAP